MKLAHNAFSFLMASCLLLAPSAWGNDSAEGNWFSKRYQHAKDRLSQIIRSQNQELYLTGYAWHNRYAYDKEKLETYNEHAWGGGYGRGIIDEDGDWQSLYGFAFLDSHKRVQPIIGYGYLKQWQPIRDIRFGIGLSPLITMRSDINNGYPFPGLVPLAAIQVKRLSFMGAYVPGHHNIGNVLFLFVRYTFGDIPPEK